MDIRTVSRAAGAAALVLGPLALALPIGVTTDGRAGTADRLAAYAARPDAALAGNLRLLPLILLIPAMVYAARLARRGAPRLAFTGGALAALGWTAGLISFGGTQILLLRASEMDDQAAAVALVDAVGSDPVMGTLVGVFVLGHIVGMVVLGVALWRSGAVATWVALLFTAYPVVHFAATALGPVADRVSVLLLLISGSALAVRLLRTPDAEWDLPAGVAADRREPVAAVR